MNCAKLLFPLPACYWRLLPTPRTHTSRPTSPTRHQGRALKRAYQLNGNSMVGKTVDLSKEIFPLPVPVKTGEHYASGAAKREIGAGDDGRDAHCRTVRVRHHVAARFTPTTGGTRHCR